VMAPTFYALDMLKVPVMISIRAIALNLIFTTVFVKVLGMGLLALPLSISLVALLNLFQLAFALTRKLGWITTGTDFPGLFLKAILLNLVFALVLALLYFTVGRWLDEFWERIIYLGIAVPVMAAGYFWLAMKMGFDEVDNLIAVVKRKAGKSAS